MPRTAEWLIWIGLGSSGGAVGCVVASLFMLDRVLGGPACEPDEGAGCGASVVLLARLSGRPGGALLGTIGASDVHGRSRRSAKARDNQPRLPG